MRLIDADAFKNYVLKEWQTNEISNGDWIRFREWLKDQKTIVEFDDEITRVMVKDIEYVPVVRCKNCKKKSKDAFGMLWCDKIYPCLVRPEGFCDEGEEE